MLLSTQSATIKAEPAYRLSLQQAEYLVVRFLMSYPMLSTPAQCLALQQLREHIGSFTERRI